VSLYDNWASDFIAPEYKSYIDIRQLPEVTGMADPKKPYIEMFFTFDEVSQSFERRV
jgi:hypothetical protein